MYRMLLSVLVFLLLLAGCKSDETTSSTNEDSPDFQKMADLVVQGRVGFGAGPDARVDFYAVVGGKVDRQQFIGSASTDGLGYFSAAVARKYSREPILIEATLAANELRCIVIEGCGDGVDFSDLMPRARGATVLRLMVPHLLDKVGYQISLLSELASAEALSELSAVSAGTISGVGNLEAQFVIAKANSKVASLFGIVDHLPTSALFDLTQMDEVLIASSPMVFSTAVESALLNECLDHIQSKNAVSEAVSFCGNQYVDRGIPGQSAGPSDVSMLGILDGVVEVLSKLQQSGRDLSVEISGVLAQRGVILSQDSDEYSKGTPSDNINLPVIEKGKHFVENVRQIASSLNLTKIVAINNLPDYVGGEAAIALTDFGVKVDTSQLLKGQKPSGALSVLKKVTLTAADILAAQFDIETGFTGDEIIARYEQVGTEHHIYFDQYLNTCDSGGLECSAYVDLKFVVELERIGGNAAVNLLNIKNLRFRISGTVTQEGYELSLNANSDSTIDYFELRQGSGVEEGLTLVELVGAKIALPIKIWSHDAALSHLFSGVLGFNVEHLLATHRNTDEEFESEGVLHKINKTRVDLYSLAGLNSNFSGKISTESGDEFYAAMNVLQTSKPFEGLLEYTSTSNENCELQEECVEVESETTFVGETAENFIGLTASVSYKANLQGVREPVQLQMSGSRKSPTETAVNSLKVTYPGHALSLSGQFNNSGGITAMDATNLDGMRMYINSDGGKRQGAVTGPGGESVGVIEDGGDWVKIRFTDGYFVSM